MHQGSANAEVKWASVVALAALAWALSAQAAPRQGPQVLAGRHIAQQYCGGCHAVGSGPSSLSDAPPFRRLYQRYGARTLGDLLHEGMLSPPGPQDEAAHAIHPRMPAVSLDADQTDELTAYLKSLEPRGRPRVH